MDNFKELVITTLLLIAVAAIVVFVRPGASSAYSDEEVAAPVITLNDIEGNAVKLAELKGKKAAVLVFFATWCPACMQEVDQVKQFTEAVKGKNIEVFGINLRESPEKVKSFIESRKTNYKILMDAAGEAGQAYNVRAIPYIVGIDVAGNIRYTGHAIPQNTKQFLGALGVTEETKNEKVKDANVTKIGNEHDFDKEGVSYISKETLQKWIADGHKLAIVDVLSPERYNSAHIKGAVNIPLAEIGKRADELKGYDLIVTYCANFKCHASTAAAEKLIKLGFEGVHDYKGGIKEWKENNLPLGD